MVLKATMLPIAFAAGCFNLAWGQTAATLKVELQNLIFYEVDTSDSSKFGTNPNPTPSGLSCTAPSFGGHLGNQIMALGDIVAVNGVSAKGTYSASGRTLCLSPTPVPGQPVADITHGPMVSETWEFLQNDGTAVGSIMTQGVRLGGPSPPGPPAGNHNFAIVGGTGAFLGARGQTSNTNSNQGLGSTSVTPPSRSITEDPGNRRVNGGGHVVWTLYVIPTSRPEVAMTPSGPAVAHSTTFSLVDASKPAVPGEILSLFATGLGPTRLALEPGQPFPSDAPAVVSSPIQVLVNDKATEVLGAVGLPGTVDGYQVNFRMPLNVGRATATIQLNAAWIAGAPVSVPVQ